jgi:hypothetical protein
LNGDGTRVRLLWSGVIWSEFLLTEDKNLKYYYCRFGSSSKAPMDMKNLAAVSGAIRSLANLAESAAEYDRYLDFLSNVAGIGMILTT